MTPVTHSFSPHKPFYSWIRSTGFARFLSLFEKVCYDVFFFPPLYCDVLKQGRHEHMAIITDGSIFHPGKIITCNNPSKTKNETPQSKTCCRAFSIMNPTKNEPFIPIILMLNILMLKSFSQHVKGLWLFRGFVGDEILPSYMATTS